MNEIGKQRLWNNYYALLQICFKDYKPLLKTLTHVEDQYTPLFCLKSTKLTYTFHFFGTKASFQQRASKSTKAGKGSIQQWNGSKSQKGTASKGIGHGKHNGLSATYSIRDLKFSKDKLKWNNLLIYKIAIEMKETDASIEEKDTNFYEVPIKSFIAGLKLLRDPVKYEKFLHFLLLLKPAQRTPTFLLEKLEFDKTLKELISFFLLITFDTQNQDDMCCVKCDSSGRPSSSLKQKNASKVLAVCSNYRNSECNNALCVTCYKKEQALYFDIDGKQLQESRKAMGSSHRAQKSVQQSRANSKMYLIKHDQAASCSPWLCFSCLKRFVSNRSEIDEKLREETKLPREERKRPWRRQSLAEDPDTKEVMKWEKERKKLTFEQSKVLTMVLTELPTHYPFITKEQLLNEMRVVTTYFREEDEFKPKELDDKRLNELSNALQFITKAVLEVNNKHTIELFRKFLPPALHFLLHSGEKQDTADEDTFASVQDGSKQASYNNDSSLVNQGTAGTAE